MADATYQDLFSTDILLHYDASAASTIFEDTGGTDAAEDGDVVKCLKPTSISALSAALTEATNGPAYRANYASSGYAALEFDGTNDILGNTAAGLSAVRFFVLYCVTIISGTSGTLWWRGDGLTHFLRNYISATNTPAFQTAGGTAFFTTLSAVTGRMVLATVFGDNQNQLDSLGICVGNKSTGTVSASVADRLYIGAGYNAGVYQPANIAFHEMLYIAGTVEWGQVLRGAKLMRSKWGITDPNGTPQAASGGGIPIARGMHGGMR